MNVFYSAEEIEDLAARGVTQLFLEENAVLTDLARDAVQRLGITLVLRSESGPVSSVAAPSARKETKVLQGAKVEFWARLADPRDGTAGSESPPAAGQDGSNSVIDRAIGLVRQLAGRSSDT